MLKRLKPLLALLLTLILSACATLDGPVSAGKHSDNSVSLRILAMNDFHGNLFPPPGGIRIRDPKDGKQMITVAAGGSEHIATALEELKRGHPNHVFVAAGDLVGATPLLSALFNDEPTIESLNLMGLEISAVGNHEFDGGTQELLRKQYGGCHPEKGCKGPIPFKGAAFKYLAASTWDTRTQKTLLPPYQIRHFDGVPVAFIGLTLKGTGDIVVPSGIVGLRFDDEAETVNRLVPELKAKGVEAIVVLIHEGGYPTGDYNECPDISGPIVDIVKRFDKAVDVVLSGHTHRAYICTIDGRLVLSGDKYGSIISTVNVQLDRSTRNITRATANNIIVRVDSFAKDPRQTELISAYDRLVQPLTRRVVGQLGGRFSREINSAGAFAAGELVADAHLAATAADDKGGAVIAFCNTGGVRTALEPEPDGTVRFAQLFAMQPFGNQLITMTLTGEEIYRLLEQQWRDDNSTGEFLQVSKGLGYRWSERRGKGQHVLPESLMLNGKQVNPTENYRVTVNNFLAGGAGGLTVLKNGRNPTPAVFDVEAVERYIAANPGLRPTNLDRIVRID